MSVLFEVWDKDGNKVRLTRERWNHITLEHPDVSSFEKVKDVILHPTAVRPSDRQPDSVKWFYKFNKVEKLYLLVSVKYLNGEGFIITSHYTSKIK